MDTFESLMADIVDDAHNMNILHPQMTRDQIAMQLAAEYREEIRISLARTFEERKS